MLKILGAVFLLSLTGLWTVKGSDFFTSMSDLKDVFQTEEKMFKSVEEYLRRERERLVKIEGKLANLKQLNREGQADPDAYLNHPFNAFLLIKRFMWEWVDLENWIKVSIPAREYIFNTTGLWSKLPGQNDIEGAAEALWRLQDTYKFTPADLLDGAKTDDSLKAHHCMEVGRLAYHVANDKYHAIPWMEEAYKLLNDETIQGDFFKMNKTEILDHLAYASYSEERLEDALAYTDKLIALVPEVKRYVDNKVYYKYLLDKKHRPRGETGDLKGLEVEEDEEEEDDEDEEEKDVEDLRKVHPRIRRYRALCRGDEEIIKSVSKVQLQTCSYQHYGRPELILQPAKEELAFDRPRILVYHDIIRDDEIEALKEFAKPRLERATIQNSTSGYLEHTKFRISKSSWVAPDENEVVRRLYRRVGAYTGLSMDSTEFLLIANYGLGGHYLPHHDFTRDNKTLEFGNRIATMLLYMSDISKGGATVFTDVGARIHPEKGSAIFWYNLFKSGQVDERTLHASCPVISGSKWVANIWMREHGQEFRRPCGIGKSEYQLLEFLLFTPLRCGEAGEHFMKQFVGDLLH